MRRRSATPGCGSTSATSATTTASTARDPRRRLRLPRRRPQAGAELRVLPARGGAHQRPRQRQRDRGEQRQRRPDRVVCLGTDKAAYPVNAMGMSKAMMEKVAQAFARNNPTAHTIVSTVRYGNVMMSRGSVIPLFVEQVRGRQAADRHRPDDDPVPDVPRRGGPAGRARLRARPARRPLHPQGAGLHDRRPGQAVAQVDGRRRRSVTVIGTRHGEKLYETLATREELARVAGPGRLLPGRRGRPRPQLRRVLRRGRRARVRARRLPLAQHRAPRRRRGRAAAGRPAQFRALAASVRMTPFSWSRSARSSC